MKNYLNFETEVKELEAKLENLKDPYNNEGISEVNTNEIASLEDKINKKLESSPLVAWRSLFFLTFEIKILLGKFPLHISYATIETA